MRQEKRKKKNKQKNIRGGEKAKSKVKTAVSLLDPKTLSLLRRPNFHVSASLLNSQPLLGSSLEERCVTSDDPNNGCEGDYVFAYI